ncbi:hypothetical protein BU16DRAFT_541890 [Lophium mytilinum]|uniref:Uncharacterized protein n=1 Tax=Lophium mytilinum TaxID=390894 RepID=A0A6A6QHP9_9PEZI|nr:hypothetical protein BU16DRAFT_541890 [Lophium mytilinum]
MAYRPRKPSTLHVVTGVNDTEQRDIEMEGLMIRDFDMGVVPNGARSPTWDEINLVMSTAMPDFSKIHRTSLFDLDYTSIASSTPSADELDPITEMEEDAPIEMEVDPATETAIAHITELEENPITVTAERDLEAVLEDILHPPVNAFFSQRRQQIHKMLNSGGTCDLTRVWFGKNHRGHFTAQGILRTKSVLRDLQISEKVIPGPYWNWLLHRDADPPQLQIPGSVRRNARFKFIGNIEKCRTTIKSSSSQANTIFKLGSDSYTTQFITDDEIVLPSPVASPFTPPPNLINIAAPLRTPGISSKFGLILSLEDNPDPPNIIYVLREPPLGAFIVAPGDKLSGEMSREWLLEQSPTHFEREQNGNIVMKKGGELHRWALQGFEKLQIDEDYWHWLVDGPTVARPHVPILHESSLRQCLMTTTPSAAFQESRPTVQFEPDVSPLKVHKTPMFRMGPPLEVRELIDYLNYPRDARGKKAFLASGKLNREWIVFLFPKYFSKGTNYGVKGTVALQHFSGWDLDMDYAYYSWLGNTALDYQPYFPGTTSKFPTKQYFEEKVEQKRKALDKMLEEVKQELTSQPQPATEDVEMEDATPPLSASAPPANEDVEMTDAQLAGLAGPTRSKLYNKVYHTVGKSLRLWVADMNAMYSDKINLDPKEKGWLTKELFRLICGRLKELRNMDDATIREVTKRVRGEVETHGWIELAEHCRRRDGPIQFSIRW